MSRRRRNTGHYEVGYGRPPLNSRYQPGCSGNPGGKPRRKPLPVDLARTLTEVLGSSVSVNEGGRKRKRRLDKVIIANMGAAAARNDARARSDLLRLARMLLQPARDVEADGEPIDYGAQVRAKLDAMSKRIQEERASKADTQIPGKQTDPGEPEAG